jgi:hypothetical protein
MRWATAADTVTMRHSMISNLKVMCTQPKAQTRTQSNRGQVHCQVLGLTTQCMRGHMEIHPLTRTFTPTIMQRGQFPRVRSISSTESRADILDLDGLGLTL